MEWIASPDAAGVAVEAQALLLQLLGRQVHDAMHRQHGDRVAHGFTSWPLVAPALLMLMIEDEVQQ